MAAPTWNVSESDPSEDEEEAKQTNGPKQELGVILNIDTRISLKKLFQSYLQLIREIIYEKVFPHQFTSHPVGI